VGKTTVATELQKKGYRIASDKDFFGKCGSGDPVELDMQCVADNLEDYSIFESHTSHLVPCIFVIHLVCSDYKLLKSRLSERDYSDSKVQENLDAEIFDVIGDEISVKSEKIDVANLSVSQVVERVEALIEQYTDYKLYKVF